MAGRRQAAPCGKDCFNCEFPECIYDRLDAEDYKQSDERDRLLTQTPQQKKLAAQQRAYREANREKLAARRKNQSQAAERESA